MEQSKEYFAFISYQRKDEKWADELRKKLEHYRLPSSIRKQDSSLPKEIRPIFRDTLELAGGVLAKEIEIALQQSKFLIVICSPNSAQSPWVNKEIQTFIYLGREEYIIPFIIDGIPFSGDEATECFPPALRNLKGERELLGINISEINRDAASIKVVARMFGLKFDTLWQRYEREQRLKRWIWAGISVLLAIIGVVIGGYFIKQNRLIESQNNQLQDLVKNLQEENNTFSQLQSDQKQYAFAGQLRGYGGKNYGIEEVSFHPYEPIIAFIDDWGVWLHYLNSNVEVNFPTYYKGEPIFDVCDLHFSADGTKLIASGHIIENLDSADYSDYVWDIERCELIGRQKESSRKKKKYTDHLAQKINYEYKNGKLYLYDAIRNKSICSTNFDSDDSLCYIESIYNPNYDEILFISNNRAALYDDTKENFVLFFKGYDYRYRTEFSESGDYLRIDKNIYARTTKIDTIQHLKYSVHRIEDYPNLPKEKNNKYDAISHASLGVDDEEGTILYKCGNSMKKIEVIRQYTMGNSQEYLKDAIFVGANKVIAIVEQGRFRIYSSKSWNLLGTLTNYISPLGGDLGQEGDLSHADTYIAMTKCINNKLFVLSSGGVIRIYDVNKYRLEVVIELPIKKDGERAFGLFIDKAYLTDDASRIFYSHYDQPFYYECELPQLKFQ